jgi:protein-L-isoaspartate(D-aspartate) O-methyltransferase
MGPHDDHKRAPYGVPEHAPYDRIIVTVGAWDIPPAWIDQLSVRGRIFVPLRFAGLTRCIAFGSPLEQVPTTQ